MRKERTLLLAALFLLSAYVLSSLITSVAMGAIAAMLFYPWMKRVERGRLQNSVAAGVFTLAATLTLFIPASAALVLGARSAVIELKRVKATNGARTGNQTSDEVLDQLLLSWGVTRFLTRTATLVPINAPEIAGNLKEFLGDSLSRLAEALSSFIARVPAMIVSFVIFLFSMFYFLSDELRFLTVIRTWSVFGKADTQRLMDRFYGLCRSVIFGSLVSGLAQSLVATSVAAAVGVKQVPAFFLAIFVSSFLPVVGTLPFMASVVLYQAAHDHIPAAWALGVTAVVVGQMDNFIRPLVIRGASGLHPLVGFLGALGGLQTFGLAGVFLGPVICGVMIEVASIVRKPA